MDECSGKVPASGIGLGMGGSGTSFQDTNQNTGSIPCHNRVGYATGNNSIKGAVVGNPDRLQFSRRTFYSGRKVTVGSSFTPSSSVNLRNSKELWSRTTPDGVVVAESSSRQGQINEFESNFRHEFLNLDPSPTSIGFQVLPGESDNIGSRALNMFSADASRASGSFTVTANSKPRKQMNRQTGNHSESSCPSLSHSISSRNVTPPISSQGWSTNAQRCGPRNLDCTEISDVFPLGCSSSHFMQDKTDALKQRGLVGETSASRGKNTVGCSNTGSTCYPRASPFQNSLVLENPLPDPASRTRNQPTSRGNAVSVRTRRAGNRESRMRLPQQGVDNTFSLPKPLLIPQVTQTRFSAGRALVGRLPKSSKAECTSRQPGSSNSAAHSRQAHIENRSSWISHGSLGDTDGNRRNIEGITEVLLALERSEEVEESTYEQLLVLERNLFLRGIAAHDQHRDMRLDIDNMSYEELLALEEKMGTVSTPLTEEALLKCLKKRIYMPESTATWITSYGDDDVKCSICQEEYAAGDDVGKLGCEHLYHVDCIHQWLRKKNWCPICKTSATLS